MDAKARLTLRNVVIFLVIFFVLVFITIELSHIASAEDTGGATPDQLWSLNEGEDAIWEESLPFDPYTFICLEAWCDIDYAAIYEQAPAEEPPPPPYEEPPPPDDPPPVEYVQCPGGDDPNYDPNNEACW